MYMHPTLSWHAVFGRSRQIVCLCFTASQKKMKKTDTVHSQQTSESSCDTWNSGEMSAIVPLFVRAHWMSCWKHDWMNYWTEVLRRCLFPWPVREKQIAVSCIGTIKWTITLSTNDHDGKHIPIRRMLHHDVSLILQVYVVMITDCPSLSFSWIDI